MLLINVSCLSSNATFSTEEAIVNVVAKSAANVRACVSVINAGYYLVRSCKTSYERYTVPNVNKAAAKLQVHCFWSYGGLEFV